MFLPGVPCPVRTDFCILASKIADGSRQLHSSLNALLPTILPILKLHCHLMVFPPVS